MPTVAEKQYRGKQLAARVVLLLLLPASVRWHLLVILSMMLVVVAILARGTTPEPSNCNIKTPPTLT